MVLGQSYLFIFFLSLILIALHEFFPPFPLFGFNLMNVLFMDNKIFAFWEAQILSEHQYSQSGTRCISHKECWGCYEARGGAWKPFTTSLISWVAFLLVVLRLNMVALVLGIRESNRTAAPPATLPSLLPLPSFPLHKHSILPLL